MMRAWATLMADYNRWMNRRLYACAAGLPAEDYRRDLGAFFGSIHATLNHVLVIDALFLTWLRGGAPDFDADPRRIVHDALPALRAARDRLDDEIDEWAGALDDDALAVAHELRPGAGRRAPVWVIAAQMFNHQTHHRGQVTAMLTRLGVDPGPTDIPAMPAFGAVVAAASR
ncbi:MAG: DinB family protein [Kofleriaceae bacterium]|nr:DinB family protein [Myxococcales bacterium]MCB9560272.1 DinB family protein [Kofleriaceae bacterium]